MTTNSPRVGVTRFTLDLDRVLHKRLRAAALDEDKHAAELVRELLTAYLDEHHPTGQVPAPVQAPVPLYTGPVGIPTQPPAPAPVGFAAAVPERRMTPDEIARAVDWTV